MKNRLLEDIDDSQSGMPVRPVRRVQAVAPPPPPSPTQVATAVPPPIAEAAPAVPADGVAPQRAGVWRSRAGAAAAQPHAAQPPQPTPQPADAPTVQPLHRSEPPPMGPGIAPELASFSSRQPDWSLPLEPEALPWTERWGRKALGWTAGLAASVALAATATWMYRDTQVETTLAVVADHTTPASGLAAAPAPSAPPAPSTPEPETEAPPPLKLLPREPVAAAPAAATAVPAPSAPAPLPATADTSPSVPVAASPAAIDDKPRAVVEKPAVKRVPERRVAAAPVKRSAPGAKKPASRPVRERVLARASPAPARSVKAARPPTPATAPPPVESPLEQTLRLCRAAGYHATACLKRGCEATRFGLACRG